MLSFDIVPASNNAQATNIVLLRLTTEGSRRACKNHDIPVNSTCCSCVVVDSSICSNSNEQ